MTLQEALDEYKNVYMAYRNFADRTREEYQNDLEDFLQFLECVGIYLVGELSVPIIERYAAQLETEGFAGVTRKRRIVAIRSFTSFLFQDHYITTDIARKIVLPFVEYASPNVLTQKECDKLRKACSDNPRDKTIVELILQTGIKLSELISLRVDDVKSESGKLHGIMRIKGTTSKQERIVPLNTKACDALTAYLKTRGEAQSNILFLNRLGEPLGESGVQKRLVKYFRSAGIIGANVQTLRHTFGTHHIAKGTDPKTVQEVLGLRDARSTSIYQTLAREVISKELQDNSL